MSCWQPGFGPSAGNGTCVADSRDHFDFTLLFERSVMSIGPSVLLPLAIPFRWLQLHSQTRKTKRGEVWGGVKLVRRLLLSKQLFHYHQGIQQSTDQLTGFTGFHHRSRNSATSSSHSVDKVEKFVWNRRTSFHHSICT
jgi:hypothetical protein